MEEKILNVAGCDVVITEKKAVKNFLNCRPAYMGVAMICFALLGFLAENTFRLFTKGIIDSRYMVLPFIGVYGLAPLAMYIILGTPDRPHFFGKKLFKTDTTRQKVFNNLSYLLIIYFFVFFGEIAVGTLYEKIAGVVLWNYSNAPLHVTKYTSFPIAGMYSAMAFLIMKFGFSSLIKLLNKKMPYKVAIIICCTLGTLILIDSILMIILTLTREEAPMLWSIKIFKK